MHNFTNLDDLTAAVKSNTESPAMYRFDTADHIVELWYGSPDQSCAQVKHLHGDAIDQDVFAEFDSATAYFLSLCAQVADLFHIDTRVVVAPGAIFAGAAGVITAISDVAATVSLDRGETVGYLLSELQPE